MTTFEIHTTDMGDSDNEAYGKSIWIAASIDGDLSRNIGAYITADGEIITDDHCEWCIDNDLVALGVDPQSEEADRLLSEWFPVAKAAGLEMLSA